MDIVGPLHTPINNVENTNLPFYILSIFDFFTKFIQFLVIHDIGIPFSHQQLLIEMAYIGEYDKNSQAWNYYLQTLNNTKFRRQLHFRSRINN